MNRNGIENYIIFLITFFTLAVLPCLYFFPSINTYDEKRIAQIGLLIITGLVFVLKLLFSKASLISEIAIPKFARWGITAVVLIGIISTWVNDYWYFGVQLMSLYLLLLVFFLYAANYSKKNVHFFVRAVLLIVVSYATFYFIKFIIGYGFYIIGRYPLWPYKAGVSSLFGWSNIRFFNHVQTWTLPLLISTSLILKKQSTLLAKSLLGLTSFWWCLIFASGGQGSFLALVGGSLLIWIVFRNNTWKWIRFFFTSLLIGLILYILLFYLQGAEGSTVVDDSTKGRLTLWSLIFKQIILQPLLGYGPLSLASVHNLPEMVHPHNSILQLAYEFGIPAMLIAVGLVCWGGIRWLIWNRKVFKEPKQLSDQDIYLRIGISVSLCAGLAHSLVSGVLVTPLSQLWLCIIAACAWGRYHKLNNPKIEKVGPIWQNVLASLTIVSVIIIGMVLWNDIPKLDKYRKYYIEQEYGFGYPPRFWQQGKIGLEEHAKPKHSAADSSAKPPTE